ncbi:hypothetical protein KJ780_01255, partial [Candidatus Micrarchaeota archaeon]|nr:hypothetical protein [Candidatus Micrarchaeota archaeon]
TLSEAMDEYYAAASPQQSGKSKKMEKLLHRLEEQEKSQILLLQDEKNAKEKGDFIYSNYQLVESLINNAKAKGINNIGNEVDNYKIIRMDKRKKEIELDL